MDKAETSLSRNKLDNMDKTGTPLSTSKLEEAADVDHNTEDFQRLNKPEVETNAYDAETAFSVNHLKEVPSVDKADNSVNASSRREDQSSSPLDKRETVVKMNDPVQVITKKAGTKGTRDRCWSVKKALRINRTMLPLKGFYFMSGLAFGCVFPYIMVFTKTLGLTSQETGVLFGIMPFLAFPVQPVMGFIADRWKIHKIILLLAILFSGTSNVLISVVPSRARHDLISGNVTVKCTPNFLPTVTVDGLGTADITSPSAACNSSAQVVKDTPVCPKSLADVMNAISTDDIHKNNSQTLPASCRITCPSLTEVSVNRSVGWGCLTSITQDADVSSPSCNTSTHQPFPQSFTIQNLQTLSHGSSVMTRNNSEVYYDDKFKDCHHFYRILSVKVDSNGPQTVVCVSDVEMRCEIHCHLGEVAAKACSADRSSSDLTFWLVFLFYLVSCLSMAPIGPMTDAMCYGLLKDEWKKFGQQRVWATIGWVVASLAATLGIYLTEQLHYHLVFYCHGALMLFCMLAQYFVRVPTDIRCSNMLRNLGRILVVPKVLALLLVVLVYGMMFGALSFVLWFLEELGAPPQIFGPFLFMGAITEIPSFFLVGRMIRRFGPIRCICVGMLAMSLRLLSYAVLRNPWLMLITEPLHGVSVGLMLGAASTYITWVSPPGMSATGQGLLAGVMHSLGRSSGVMICGWLFRVVGARFTYALYAGLGTLLMVVYALLNGFVFTELLPPQTDKELKTAAINGESLPADVHVPLLDKTETDLPPSCAETEPDLPPSCAETDSGKTPLSLQGEAAREDDCSRNITC